MKGAAQDPTAGRGGVKDPRSGPGPILEAAPHHGEAWAEAVRQWGYSYIPSKRAMADFCPYELT